MAGQRAFGPKRQMGTRHFYSFGNRAAMRLRRRSAGQSGSLGRDNLIVRARRHNIFVLMTERCERKVVLMIFARAGTRLQRSSGSGVQPQLH